MAYKLFWIITGIIALLIISRLLRVLMLGILIAMIIGAVYLYVRLPRLRRKRTNS